MKANIEVFLVLTAAFVATVQATLCIRPDNCTNPCEKKRCQGHPRALCYPYFCKGECDNIFYENGRRVNCNDPTPSYFSTTQATTPSQNMIAVCPPVPSGYFGTCAEDCKDDGFCERSHRLCCSNGCGRRCRRPILVPREKATVTVPLWRQRLSHISGTCPNLPPTSCLPATINCERECPLRRQLCCPNGCGGKTCLYPIFSKTAYPIYHGYGIIHASETQVGDKPDSGVLAAVAPSSDVTMPN